MKISIEKNLFLEQIEKKHSRELFKLTEDNRAFLRKWLPWVDLTNSEKDTLAFIEMTRKNINGNNGLQFAIKCNGKIAGMIGLAEIGKFENKTEIGYWLAEKYNGYGIMTKSCNALVKFCFNKIKLNRIVIRCDVKNKQSRGIPERIGFFKQGILKHDEYRNGKYFDRVQYSITKKEWNENKSNNEICIFGCHDHEAAQYDENVIKGYKNKKNYIREKYFEIHEEVLRMAELKAGDQVLDIGIGTGLLEEKISRSVKIYGIDISTKMMEKAKEKNLNIEFKTGSFNSIPYPDKTFHIIISCFAFHHLTDNEKELAIIEMKRVLKSRGRIIIGDLMYFNIKVKKILEKKFKKEKRCDVIGDMEEEYFTNLEWFSKQLEKNNFDVKYKQVSTLSWVLKAALH